MRGMPFPSEGPGLQVFAVSYLIAQTPAVAAGFPIAAVETPAGCSCPGLRAQPLLWSPLYPSDPLEPW